MFYTNDTQLCFDDILLVPQKSLKSRKEANTSSKLDDLLLEVPVISANMKSVTWYDMAYSMYRNGGIGALHRANMGHGVDDQLACIKQLEKDLCCVFGSIGLHEDEHELEKLLNTTRYWILDVANAYSDEIADRIKEIKDIQPDIHLMVGNVSTPEGVYFLIKAGADSVKVGQGPGATCTTRMVTGHGYPQFSAINRCSKVGGVPIIADGGIKEVGDIAKALAVGASAVMCGYLLAGCHESAGNMINGRKEYYGNASAKGIIKEGRLEGVVGYVESTGKVSEAMEKIKAGLQSAMSYSGARTLEEFREKAKFVRVSGNTLIENMPRVLR